MVSSPIEVEGLKYQSGNITMPEWVSLLTLCFSPLLAHVVAGAPHPTCLSRNRPSWHDRLCHYNPVSILWRYGAITDRRVRARAWCPANMAAANAIFWTGAGWDGSEEMAARSVLYCISLPEQARLSLFSWSAIKTAIVTIQGVQAVVTITGSIFARWDLLNSGFSIDTAFLPISILGLLRLYAAFWLTDDFNYVMRDDVLLQALSDPYLEYSPSLSSVGFVGMRDATRLLDPGLTPRDYHFRPSTYWPSRVFRGFFVANIIAILGAAIFTVIPVAGYHRIFSATVCVVSIGGLVFLAITVAIYSYYLIRCSGFKSTVIPCISTAWYKTCTALVFTWLLAIAVVSAIETRRTPCGRFTTVSERLDSTLCPGLMNVGPGFNSTVFGLAASSPNHLAVQNDGWFLVVGFTGTCQGFNGSVKEARFGNASSMSLR